MTHMLVDSTLHITLYGDDEFFVRRGSRSTFSKVVRDEGRRGILPLVLRLFAEPRDRSDGAASVAEQSGVEPESVEDVIDLLARHDVVRPVVAEAAVPAAVTVAGAGELPQVLTTLLGQGGVDCSTVALDSGGAEDDLRLAEAFAELEHGNAVLAFDHARPASSYAANELAMEHLVNVLHVSIDGSEVVVGPFVVPGETACYTCFDVQDEGSRHLRHDYIAYKDQLAREPRSGARTSPVSVHLAAAWSALAVQQVVDSGHSFLHGRVLRIDLDRVEVVTHRVLQLPRCPACSRVRHEPRHVFL